MPVSLSSPGSIGALRRARVATGAGPEVGGLAEGVGVGVGVAGAGVGAVSWASAGNASATAIGTSHSLLARIRPLAHVGFNRRHRHFARLGRQQDQDPYQEEQSNDEDHDSRHRLAFRLSAIGPVEMGLLPSLASAV